MSKEGKQISVHNQKVINISELQINQLTDSLLNISKKASINQFKHLITKSHSLLSGMQLVFKDHNFQQVFDNVRMLFMSLEIIFLHLIERIEQKNHYGAQKRISVHSNNPEAPKRDSRLSLMLEVVNTVDIKSPLGKSQHCVETVKLNPRKMGGICLFNQNYQRGLQIRHEASQKKGPKKTNNQVIQESKQLMDQMDEAQIQLRLQSDQIQNFLALRRNKQSIFNYVSYSQELEEIAHFFKQTQNDALQFLNTSRNTNTVAEHAQQFGALMEQLRQQKQQQSATVANKINQIVEYLKKKNQQVHIYITKEFETLQKLKKQMNKPKIDNSSQTTHNFQQQIKHLNQRILQERHRSQAFEDFREEYVNYEDQYFEAVRSCKMKEMECIKTKKLLQEKGKYIEELEKTIRLSTDPRTKKSISYKSQDRQQNMQPSQKIIITNQTLIEKQYLRTENYQNFKKRKSSQIHFIKDLINRRESSVVNSQYHNSDNGSYQIKKSSFGNNNSRNRSNSGKEEQYKNDYAFYQQLHQSKNGSMKKIKLTKVGTAKKIKLDSSSENQPQSQMIKKKHSIQANLWESQGSLIKSAQGLKTSKSREDQVSIGEFQDKQQIGSSIENIVYGNKTLSSKPTQLKRQSSQQMLNMNPSSSHLKLKRKENIKIPRDHFSNSNNPSDKVYSEDNYQQEFIANTYSRVNIRTPNSQAGIEVQRQKNRISEEEEDYQNEDHVAQYAPQNTRTGEDRAHPLNSLYLKQNQQEKQVGFENKLSDKQHQTRNKDHSFNRQQLGFKINIVDINHQQISQTYNIPIKENYGILHRPQLELTKKRSLEYSNQQKIPDPKSGKRIDKKVKNKWQKRVNIQNESMEGGDSNFIQGQGYGCSIKLISRVKAPHKERLISLEYAVTILPSFNRTYITPNITKLNQKQIQQQFLNLIASISKTSLPQGPDQQKLIHFYSQHRYNQTQMANKKKKQYRQTTTLDGQYKLNIPNIKKNKLVKKPINKNSLYKSVQQEDKRPNDDIIEFERLRELWKNRYVNIQDTKQKVIRRHLESCGEYCVHLQRYLQMFKKIGEQDRITMKVHIENLNKYQESDKQNQQTNSKAPKQNSGSMRKKNHFSLPVLRK